MNLDQFNAHVDEYESRVQQPLYEQYWAADDAETKAAIYRQIIKNWLAYRT